MLLPRPEIRIATRFGSRIVSCRQVLQRVPWSGPPVHGAAAFATFDAADLEDGFTSAFEQVRNLVDVFGRNNHRHSDAAVEGSNHLLGDDASSLLEENKNRGQFPSPGIDDGMAISRQNPWNILEKSTAGDV